MEVKKFKKFGLNKPKNPGFSLEFGVKNKKIKKTFSIFFLCKKYKAIIKKKNYLPVDFASVY